MLNNLSKQPTPLTANPIAEPIPDPWDDTTNTSESQANIISSIKVLIEDGLKIKAFNGDRLKEHLKEALGLLSWMVNISSEYAS